MSVGILFGTYSSVFVASSLVVDLTKERVLSGKAVEEKAPTTAKPAVKKVKA